MTNFPMSAEEFLKQTYPTRVTPDLVFDEKVFCTFDWLGELWIQMMQIDELFKRNRGYCYSWANRCPVIFSKHMYKTIKCASIVKGTSRRRALICLEGVVIMTNRIKTEEALAFGEWAEWARRQNKPVRNDH